MSTKFEQLLDYLVNEEMDKANELFHEIVVEKSREIYENLIAEEENQQDEAKDEQDESVEETAEEAEESVEEGSYEDESVEEDMDEPEMESSFSADDADPTGDLGSDVDASADSMPGDDMPGEEGDASPEEVKDEIADVIGQLEMLLSQMGGEESSDEMPASDEFGDDDDEESNEMMGFNEGRRMTREYVEKVSDGHGAEKKGKAEEGDGSAGPVSKGSGKPSGGNVSAKNIAQAASEAAPDGTKPHGKAGGLVKPAQDMKTGNGNVPGGSMGVKNLSKVGAGYPGNNKNPGPVGSGTGDKAGQTAVAATKQFLKPAN